MSDIEDQTGLDGKTIKKHLKELRNVLVEKSSRGPWRINPEYYHRLTFQDEWALISKLYGAFPVIWEREREKALNRIVEVALFGSHQV